MLINRIKRQGATTKCARSIMAREARAVSTYALLLIIIAILLTGCGQGGTPQAQDPPGQSESIMTKEWHFFDHFEFTNAVSISLSDQHAAKNAQGLTMAVWVQRDPGTRNNVWSALYNSHTRQWSESELIEQNDNGDAMGAKVVIDSPGNAIATWFQFDGAKFSIYVNRYDSAAGVWQNATEIDLATGGHAMNPSIVMDASGSAVVVWYQQDGTRYSVLSSRYDAVGDTWGAPEFVEASDVGDTYHPSIEITPSGRVMAVWKQYDGAMYSIWANTYEPGSGWGTAALIENESMGDAYDPTLALKSNGDAVAVWHQYDGTMYSIYANRYDAQSDSWSGAVLLETIDAGNAYTPKAAMDMDGNAIAVWLQDDGTRYAIFANRFDALSNAWQGPVQLDLDEGTDSDAPDIAMDSNGNAIVVWNDYGISSHIHAIRYDAITDNWRSLVQINELLIEKGENLGEHGAHILSGDAYTPHIRFDHNNMAILTWKNVIDGISGSFVALLI